MPDWQFFGIINAIILAMRLNNVDEHDIFDNILDVVLMVTVAYAIIRAMVT